MEVHISFLYFLYVNAVLKLMCLTILASPHPTKMKVGIHIFYESISPDDRMMVNMIRWSH